MSQKEEVKEPQVETREHQLLSLIDEVKEKLTDNEYKKIVEKLREVDAKKTGFYEIKFFRNKCVFDEDEDMKHIIAGPYRRIVKVFFRNKEEHDAFTECEIDSIFTCRHFVDQNRPFTLDSNEINFGDSEDDENIGVFSIKKIVE